MRCRILTLHPPGGLNSTYALIPKIGNPTFPVDNDPLPFKKR